MPIRPLPERDWYTGPEVAVRFDVSPEAIRLAGIAGRIPVLEVSKAHRTERRYPKEAIDQLEELPSRRPRRRPITDSQRFALAEYARLQDEMAGLRRELEQERVERAVSDIRISDLVRTLERYKIAFKALLDDGDVGEKLLRGLDSS